MREFVHRVPKRRSQKGARASHREVQGINERVIAIESLLVLSAFDKRELRYIYEVLHELGAKLEVVAANGYVGPDVQRR